MDSQRDYNIDIPAVTIPATKVFAHTTRMSDFDSPAIEQIIKPASEFPRQTVNIHLEAGDTMTRAECQATPDNPIARMKHEIKRAMHRRVPLIDLKDCVALDLRGHYMGNYAHLIHDALGPMHLIKQTLAKEGLELSDQVTVILPQKPPSLAVRVFDNAEIPYVCTDGVVRGQLVTIQASLNIGLLPYLAHQKLVPWPEPTPDRVFISRRGNRSLLNEDQVSRYLSSKGFTKIYMEDIPLGQQWSLLANANEIVGIHGAGLSSLGFSIHRARTAGPRFRLIELFSPGFASSCFRDYAAILGGKWVGVRGKITPDVVRDLDLLGKSRAHDQASFEVDIDSLSAALNESRSESC